MEFVAEKSGERLDKFLAEHYTGLSRSQFQRAIQNGAIKLNGREAPKAGVKLKKGDKIVILEEKIIAPGKNFAVEPEPDIPLTIVYEDKDIVVIDKAAGLLTHPTISQPKHTLANALLARYPEMKTVGESPLRPGIVHRLDKETSGLIIACKNQKAFEFIKEQFLNRKVSKKYLALVEGVPSEKSGTIVFDIRPSTMNRLKKVAVKKTEPLKKSRRTATTDYAVTKTFGDKFALMEAMPKTGRTHQIRVHLSAIGHPIVGDRLYGSKSKLSKRQFLHAFSLNFTAPNKKSISLQADLPADLQAILEKLK